MSEDNRPVACPNGHTHIWLAEHVSMCRECGQGVWGWTRTYMSASWSNSYGVAELADALEAKLHVESAHRTLAAELYQIVGVLGGLAPETIPVLVHLSAIAQGETPPETALLPFVLPDGAGLATLRDQLAQMTTERDHWRDEVQRINGLALEAAAKYDREREARERAEARTHEFLRRIVVALDVDDTTDDEDSAVASVEGLMEDWQVAKQRAERAEAACTEYRAALELMENVRRGVSGETTEFDSVMLIDAWDRVRHALAADNPGAALLRVVEAARKRQSASRELGMARMRKAPDKEIRVLENALDRCSMELNNALEDVDAKGASDATNLP